MAKLLARKLWEDRQLFISIKGWLSLVSYRQGSVSEEKRPNLKRLPANVSYRSETNLTTTDVHATITIITETNVKCAYLTIFDHVVVVVHISKPTNWKVTMEFNQAKVHSHKLLGVGWTRPPANDCCDCAMTANEIRSKNRFKEGESLFC